MSNNLQINSNMHFTTPERGVANPGKVYKYSLNQDIGAKTLEGERFFRTIIDEPIVKDDPISSHFYKNLSGLLKILLTLGVAGTLLYLSRYIPSIKKLIEKLRKK